MRPSPELPSAGRSSTPERRTSARAALVRGFRREEAAPVRGFRTPLGRQHAEDPTTPSSEPGPGLRAPLDLTGLVRGQPDAGGEGQPLLSKGPKAPAAVGIAGDEVTAASAAKIRALVDKQVARRTENPANFHQATANFVLAGDTRLIKPLAAPPENVSRFSTAEMALAWEAVDKSLTKDEVLVSHFSSISGAELILGASSPGFRASTVGQGGGGVSVTIVGPHELGWDKFQGGDFRKSTGEALWGEKANDLLLGGKDADKVDLVFLVKIPRFMLDASMEVPGRPLVRIIPASVLYEHTADERHYLQKEKITKTYVLLKDAPPLNVEGQETDGASIQTQVSYALMSLALVMCQIVAVVALVASVTAPACRFNSQCPSSGADLITGKKKVSKCDTELGRCEIQPDEISFLSLTSIANSDKITLLVAALVVSFNVAREVRDIRLCNLTIEARAAGSRWRYPLYAVGWLRQYVVVPSLVCSVPLLVLLKGSDTTSICLNTVAVLFLLELDNQAYEHGLNDRTRANVEEVGRAVIDSAASKLLEASKNAHIWTATFAIIAPIIFTGMVAPFESLENSETRLETCAAMYGDVIDKCLPLSYGLPFDEYGWRERWRRDGSYHRIDREERSKSFTGVEKQCFDAWLSAEGRKWSPGYSDYGDLCSDVQRFNYPTETIRGAFAEDHPGGYYYTPLIVGDTTTATYSAGEITVPPIGMPTCVSVSRDKIKLVRDNIASGNLSGTGSGSGGTTGSGGTPQVAGAAPTGGGVAGDPCADDGVRKQSIDQSK